MDGFRKFLIATTYLSDGTKGCGSILAITPEGELLAIGDGDTSETLEYDNVTADMIDLSEVTYE